MANRTFNKVVLIDGIADQTDLTKLVSFDISGATTATTTDLGFSQTVNRTITFPDNDGEVILQNSEAPTITTVSSAIDVTKRNSFLNSSLSNPSVGLATLADSPFGVYEKTITYSTVTTDDEPIDITVTGVVDASGVTQTTIRLPNSGTSITLVWNGVLWLVQDIIGLVVLS